jgi:hypothetical protein
MKAKRLVLFLPAQPYTMAEKEKHYALTLEGRALGEYATFAALWRGLLEHRLGEALTREQLEYYLHRYGQMRFQCRYRWYAVTRQ